MKAKINTKSYIISVSLGTGCYRHIRISGKASLEELSDAILDAFDFDNDHLHAFFMNNKAWDDEHCYSSAYAEDGCPDTYNCRLQFVGLEEGKKFLYIFDFGDNWQFKCKVLKVLDEDTKTAEVIRTKGEAPKQYPEYDEDGYDDDFDEDEFEYDDEDEGITEPGELPVPVPDELYDLALRFKKAKLWDKLCDIDLFAVRLSNGQDGYCSIMGNEGSYFALALYIGEKGLLSCYRIFNGQYLRTEDERFEHMLSQDCLQVCFDNKDTLCSADLKSVQDYAKRNGVHFRGAHSYPFFQKMKPMYRPWFIDDKIDHILLREALEAALFIAEKLKNTTAEALGFTDGLVIPYVINDGSKIVLQHTHLPKKLEEEFPTPSLSASKTAEQMGMQGRIHENACSGHTRRSTVFSCRTCCSGVQERPSFAC